MELCNLFNSYIISTSLYIYIYFLSLIAEYEQEDTYIGMYYSITILFPEATRIRIKNFFDYTELAKKLLMATEFKN